MCFLNTHQFIANTNSTTRYSQQVMDKIPEKPKLTSQSYFTKKMKPLKNIIGRMLSFMLILNLLTSCVSINNTPYKDGLKDKYYYKPIPINRERGGITYFNLNHISKIRTDGVAIEIVKSHKQELEVASNYKEYLRVMQLGDELLIYYDFPRTGPHSGLHKIEQNIRLHFNQPITQLTVEDGGRIMVRDLLFTPRLKLNLAGGSIKCDVNTPYFILNAYKASTFTGWVEARRVNVNLANAAAIEMGGFAENAEIYARNASVFDGSNFQVQHPTVQSVERSQVYLKGYQSLQLR